MSTFTIQLNTEPRIFEVLSALFQKLRSSEPPFLEDDASIVDAAPTTTTTTTSTATSSPNSTPPPPPSTTAKNNTKSPTKSTSPTPKQTNNIVQRQLQTNESTNDNNNQINSTSYSAVTNELTIELTKMFNMAISGSPISSSHNNNHTTNTNSGTSSVSAFTSATINHNNNSNSNNNNNNTSMFSSLGLSGEIQVLAQILNPIVRSNTSTTTSSNNNNSQSLSSQHQQNNTTASSNNVNSHFINNNNQRGYILHYPSFDLGVKRTLHQALSLLKRINEIMIATQTGTVTSSFRNLTLFFGIIQSLSIHCNSNTADLLPLIAAETFLVPVLRLYSVFREQQEKRELGNHNYNNSQNNNNNSRQNQLKQRSSSSASPVRNNSNNNNNNIAKTKPSITSKSSSSSVVDAELRAAHEKLKKRNFTVEFDEFKKRAKQLFGSRDETALASLRDSFCVEFLLDCVLPPAVCSARFDALQAFAYERKASFASIVLQMKAVTSLVIRSGSMSHINCAMLLGLYAETKSRFKLLEKMLQEGLLTRVLAALRGETGAPQLLFPSSVTGMNSGTLSAASSPKLVVPVTNTARFSGSPKTLSKPPLSSHNTISSQQQQSNNATTTLLLGIPVHEQVPELISASLNPAQKRLKNLTTALEALVYLSTLAQQEEYSEIGQNSISSTSSPKNESKIFLGSSVSFSSSSSSAIIVDRIDIALQSIAIPNDAQGFLCWCYSENISQIIDVAFSILQEPQKALQKVVASSSLQENQQQQQLSKNNDDQHHTLTLSSPKQKVNRVKSPAATTKSNTNNSPSFVIPKTTLETIANLSSSFIVQSLRLRSKILYQVLRKVDELFDRILPSSVSELVPVLVAIIDCGDKIAANVDKQEILAFQEQQKLQGESSNNKNAKGSPLTAAQQSRLSTNNAVSRPSFANNNNTSSQNFIQAGFVTHTATSAVNSDLEVLMEQKKIVQDIQRYVAEWFFSLSRHVESIAKKLLVSTNHNNNNNTNLQENRRRIALDLVPHFRLWLNVLPILLRGEKEGLLHLDTHNNNNLTSSSSTVIASSPFATQQVATAIENYGVTVLEVAQFVSAPGAAGRRLCPPLVQSVALAVLNAHAAYHPDIQREQQIQKAKQRLLSLSASKKDNGGNTPNSKSKSPSPTGAKKNAKTPKSASPSPPPKSLFEMESVALILQTIPEKPEAKFYASSSQQLRLVTSRSQTMRVQRSPSSNRFATSPTKIGKSKIENSNNNYNNDKNEDAASPEQTLGVVLGISNNNNNKNNKNNTSSRAIMMHQTAAMEAASSPKQAGGRRGRSSSNNDSENLNRTSGMKMMDLKTFSFDGDTDEGSVTSPTVSTSQQSNNNNKGGTKKNSERLSNVLFSAVALDADDAASNNLIAKGKTTPDSEPKSRGKIKAENNINSNKKNLRTKEDVALFQDDDDDDEDTNTSNSDDIAETGDDDDDDDEESIATLLSRGKQKNQELGRPSPTQKTGRRNKNLTPTISSALLNNKYAKKELIQKSFSPSSSIIATVVPKRKSASTTTSANIIINKPQLPLSPIPNRSNQNNNNNNNNSSPPPPTGMFGRISAAIKSLTSSPIKESSSNNNLATNIQNNNNSQTLPPPQQPNFNNNQERSIFDIDSAINSPRIRRNNNTNQVDSAASPLTTTSGRSGTANNQEQNAPIPWTQRLSGLFRF